MLIYLLALLLGVIAGLRTMTPPAAVAWAIHLDRLNPGGALLIFLGNVWVRLILTVFAIVELIVDQLPSTPSRKVPVQFGARVLTGGLSGAAVGASGGSWVVGLVAGMVGAVVGTLGGSAFRARLAAAFGSDRPAALTEDAVAIIGALLIVVAL